MKRKSISAPVRKSTRLCSSEFLFSTFITARGEKIAKNESIAGVERSAMEEDERREAAIAFRASSLRSDLKPKSSIISSQLSKFQELHRRRLKIKAKSKVSKKPKGVHDGNDKFEETDVVTDNCKNKEELSLPIEDSGAIAGNTSSREQGEAGAHLVSTKKRQKLHWGLDTKKRWEMKANM